MNQEFKRKIEGISIEDLKSLASYNDLYCISIYLPKNESAKNANQKFEKFLLDYQRENQREMIEGMTQEAINTHLSEFKQFLHERDSISFKNNLVVFFSKQFTKVFSLSDKIPFKIYLNNHFYIKYLSAAKTSISGSKYNKKKSKKILAVDEVIKESSKGNVKVLFVNKRKDIYGEYDEPNNFVIKSDINRGTSLTNIAIKNTLLHDGKVLYSDTLNCSNLIHAITY